MVPQIIKRTKYLIKIEKKTNFTITKIMKITKSVMY
jgi:hypothetical protein